MSAIPSPLTITFAANASSQSPLLQRQYCDGLIDASAENLTAQSIKLDLPTLGEYDHEYWHATAHEQAEMQHSVVASPDPRLTITVTRGTDYCFIRLVCQETGAAADHDELSELEALTHLAYKQLFGLIHSGQLPPTIIRLWNFIPEILRHSPRADGTSDLDRERYRQFNSGRRTAWQQYSDLHDTETGHYRVPAATGIGIASGALVIECLLADGQVVDIENPRQISAYSYSPTYGKQPPMFARATAYLPAHGQASLFISGTASIIGEDTVHLGDAAAQTHETFANLIALIASENVSTATGYRPAIDGLAALRGVRVHVRYAADYPAIRAVVEHYLGNTPICYLRGDICRDGLLVEIEANAIDLLPAA